MTPAEIAREIERVIDFPAHRKHVCVPVDVAVLRAAVRELKVIAATEIAGAAGE